MTSLAAVEFVQQWCLHILPKEFTKTRQYGAWSSKKREVYLEQCRSLAATLRKSPSAEQSEADGVGQRSQQNKESSGSTRGECLCIHCQEPMRCMVVERRPSWRELFYGPDHPSWFEWTSRGMCVPPDEEDVEVIQESESAEERVADDTISEERVAEERVMAVVALESMIRQRSEAEGWVVIEESQVELVKGVGDIGTRRQAHARWAGLEQ